MSDNYIPNTPTDIDKHRYVFLPLKYSNKDMAHIGELVVDEETGEIWYKKSDGELVSPSNTMRESLEKLMKSELLYQTAYNINNASIYNVYYTSNGKCRLDDAIKLSKNTRYYSIRKSVDPSNNGGASNVYITGVPAENGGVANPLMDISYYTSDPSIEFSGVADIGHIAYPDSVVSGSIYYLDFYDFNRLIVTTVPCQLINVASMEFALTSEQNIVGLSISTSQNYGDEDENGPRAFINKGQDPESVNLYVYANYSDGTSRLLNSDAASGKLTITYNYSDRDKETVINTPGNEFTIEARYFFEYVSGDSNQNYVEGQYTSITKKITFVVVDAAYKPIRYLIPIPFIKKVKDEDTNTISTTASIKTFAIYEDFSDADVSNDAALSFVWANGEGNGDTFDPNLGTALRGTAYYQMSPGNVMSTAFTITTTPDALDDDPKFRITIDNLGAYYAGISNGILPSYRVMFNTSKFEGQLALAIVKKDNNGGYTPIDASVLANDGKVKYGSTATVKTPNFFRIRSLINTTHVYTLGMLPISSMGAKEFQENNYNFFPGFDETVANNKLGNYLVGNNGLEYPVLIELFYYNPTYNTYELCSVIPADTKVADDSKVGENEVEKHTYRYRYNSSTVIDGTIHYSPLSGYETDTRYGNIVLKNFNNDSDITSNAFGSLNSRLGAEFVGWTVQGDQNDPPIIYHAGQNFQLTKYGNDTWTEFIAAFNTVAYYNVYKYTGDPNPTLQIAFNITEDNGVYSGTITAPGENEREGFIFDSWSLNDSVEKYMPNQQINVTNVTVGDTSSYNFTGNWMKYVAIAFSGKQESNNQNYYNPCDINQVNNKRLTLVFKDDGLYEDRFNDTPDYEYIPNSEPRAAQYILPASMDDFIDEFDLDEESSIVTNLSPWKKVKWYCKYDGQNNWSPISSTVSSGVDAGKYVFEVTESMTNIEFAVEPDSTALRNVTVRYIIPGIPSPDPDNDPSAEIAPTVAVQNNLNLELSGNNVGSLSVGIPSLSTLETMIDPNDGSTQLAAAKDAIINNVFNGTYSGSWKYYIFKGNYDNNYLDSDLANDILDMYSNNEVSASAMHYAFEVPADTTTETIPNALNDVIAIDMNDVDNVYVYMLPEIENTSTGTPLEWLETLAESESEESGE